MRSRIHTLLLDANGIPSWRHTLIDTALHPAQGLLAGMRVQGIRGHGVLSNLARKILFPYDQLGYMLDWREAFLAHPALDAEVCNINDRFALSTALKRIADFEVVIIMHSAAGDDMTTMLGIAERLRERRGKLIMFIGNEYDLMAEKFSLIEQAAVDIVCSMLPAKSAQWLYGDGVRVHPVPQALNPAVYYPVPGVVRDIDLGFIGSFYLPFIGDEDRNKMLSVFMDWAGQTEANVDIRIGNIPRREWAKYLRRCVNVAGAESGTFYLDRQGDTLAKAKSYWRQNPRVSFTEMEAKFFSGELPVHVTGKHITSRHFEAMGSMACQVLLEGEYNDIIRPREHYIQLKRDYSNFDEVVRQVQDRGHCQQIARRAYELVLGAHTYKHRVDDLIRIL